jgi:hypothetical protein
VQDDGEQGVVDLEPVRIVDEAQSLNFFMKRFTRDRVVPTISANVS